MACGLLNLPGCILAKDLLAGGSSRSRYRDPTKFVVSIEYRVAEELGHQDDRHRRRTCRAAQEVLPEMPKVFARLVVHLDTPIAAVGDIEFRPAVPIVEANPMRQLTPRLIPPAPLMLPTYAPALL